MYTIRSVITSLQLTLVVRVVFIEGSVNKRAITARAGTVCAKPNPFQSRPPHNMVINPAGKGLTCLNG
jgi:hypothetical protein